MKLKNESEVLFMINKNVINEMKKYYSEYNTYPKVLRVNKEWFEKFIKSHHTLVDDKGNDNTRLLDVPVEYDNSIATFRFE